MFKVLIIEDDEKIRDIILDNLNKWGFEGKYVEDFNNILDTFIKFNPNIVLLDINLPTYDGFHWCNKIREISKIPVIFISSRNTNMDIIMSINMGGDDFIQKPFSMDVLIAKMNAILRRTYSYSNVEMNVLEHEGVILNLKDTSIIYKDEIIDLTKNEFKIAYILMKNIGNVVSRDKIMRSLWEDESFVDDNTLTVNINRLRKKLSSLHLDDFIKTKKGQGYIIE